MLSRRLYVLLFSMTRAWSEIIVRFVRVSVWASGQMENRYFEGVLELLKYILNFWEMFIDLILVKLGDLFVQLSI